MQTCHALTMGGLATLHFGLTYSSRARSLLVAGAGYGSEPGEREKFRAEAVTGRHGDEDWPCLLPNSSAPA